MRKVIVAIAIALAVAGAGLIIDPELAVAGCSSRC